MDRRSSHARQFAAALLVSSLNLMGAAAPVSAQDTRVSAAVTARFASGDFGTSQTTTSLVVPASLRLERGRFEVSGLFPFVSIHDATGALSQGGWIPMQGTVGGSPNSGMPVGGGFGMMGHAANVGTSPVPQQQPVLISSSGLGDIAGSVGYRVVDDTATGLQLVVSGRMKLPTASSNNGLGTGKADIGVVGTARKRLDRGWLYAEAGYLAVGKPAGTALQNAVLWGVGGGWQLARQAYLLGSAVGNTTVVSGYSAPVEVGAGLGVRATPHVSITALPSVGLSNASPNYAFTIGLTTDVRWR